MAYQHNYFQRKTKPKGPRTNERIRAQEVQVINSQGQNLGTLRLKEAIEAAGNDAPLKDMDLSVIEPIHESTVIEDVVQLTLDNPYPIPIVDDENILTGLATHDAILQAFAENALQQQSN